MALSWCMEALIFSWTVFSLCTKGFGITVPKDYVELSARGVGQALAHCIGAAKKIECLERKVTHTLDKAIQDNSTWQYGRYLLFERNAAEEENLWDNKTEPNQRSISDRIGYQLLQLAQSRSLRLKLPPVAELMNLQAYAVGISNAVDDFAAASGGGDVATEAVNVNAAPSGDEGTLRHLKGLGVDDKIAQIYAGRKRRKKKDKDKNMAMMGGMTIMAMLAQMFLGKVILIAGAAFVMAKIALLISILGSLKKQQMGGGGGTEHVIVTSGGHGHESSGWHRSMPYEYTKVEEIDDHEDHADEREEPPTSTYPTTVSGGWTAGWHRRMSDDYMSKSANIRTELDSGHKLDSERSQNYNTYRNHRLTETVGKMNVQNQESAGS